MIHIGNEALVRITAVAGSVVVTATIEAGDQSEYDGIVSILNALTVPEVSDALDLSVSQVQLVGSFPPSPSPNVSWEETDGWIVESLITAAVLLGSTVLALCLSFWVKKFVNPSFQMMQTVDIALAATDFGTDVLFIVTAFSLNIVENTSSAAEGESADGNAAASLAWASLIFPFIAGYVLLWLSHGGGPLLETPYPHRERHHRLAHGQGALQPVWYPRCHIDRGH
jgi:hypothetical protein